MSKPRLIVPFLAISASLLAGIELMASPFPSQAVSQSSKSEQAQSESPKPLFYFVSTGDLKLEHRVSPAYPPGARLGRLQGDVVLDLTVGADGSVSDAKVKGGPPVLVNAALEAVRQWKYAASSQLPATTSVLVQFRLERPLPSGFKHDRNHYPNHGLFVNGDGPYPSPFYPEEAKRQHIQGMVALEVTADADGEISDYRVLKSDHELLTEASVRLLKAPLCSAQDLGRSAQLRCRAMGLSPGLLTVVIQFSLDRPKRSFSSGSPLLVFAYLTQAPADLVVMHGEVALYPEEAQRNRLEGDVQIQLEVNGEGEVKDAAILSGPEPLQDVALEAAKRWRFIPPSEAPVEVIVTYLFWIPN